MANDLRFLACITAAGAAAPRTPVVVLTRIVRAVLDQVDGYRQDLATVHALPGAEVPARHETPVGDVVPGEAVWHDFDADDRAFRFVVATEVDWDRITLFYEGGLAGHFEARDRVLVANDAGEADRFNRATWACPLDELARDGRTDDPTGGGWAA